MLLKDHWGKTIFDNTGAADKSPFGVYQQGLDTTKSQVAGANQAVTSGYGKASQVWDNSGVIGQYDTLFNQLLSSKKLNSTIQAFKTAGTEAKGYITEGRDASVAALSAGAEDALVTLNTALSEGMGAIQEFKAKHGEKEMFDLGWLGMEDIIRQSGQQIINSVQRLGMSPSVIKGMTDQWNADVLQAGSGFARQNALDAIGVSKDVLNTELGYRGGLGQQIAGVQERKGLGLADLHTEAAKDLANITMEVPQLTSNLEQQNASLALGALQGKTGVLGQQSALEADKAKLISGNTMTPNYLGSSVSMANVLMPSTSKASKEEPETREEIAQKRIKALQSTYSNSLGLG